MIAKIIDTLFHRAEMTKKRNTPSQKNKTEITWEEFVRSEHKRKEKKVTVEKFLSSIKARGLKNR